MYSRVAFALVGLIAILAGPAAAGERLTSIDLAGHATSLWHFSARPDGDWPPYYAAAMLNYRHFAGSLNGERSGGAYPMLPGSNNLNGLAWVWVAPDGSHVQRVNRGLFRLFERERSSTFYRVIDCRPAEWPGFQCTDGRRREMSAPSHALLIFDHKQFERVFLPRVPAARLASD
ncbi:MAG: hypothetical protein WDZ83_04215 [Rhizobiaceae bacterium]